MAEEDGAASAAGGMLGVGQVVGAVGEVCGGSRRWMSWGDAARSSWSGMMRPGNFLDFLVGTI